MEHTSDGKLCTLIMTLRDPVSKSPPQRIVLDKFVNTQLNDSKGVCQHLAHEYLHACIMTRDSTIPYPYCQGRLDGEDVMAQ